MDQGAVRKGADPDYELYAKIFDDFREANVTPFHELFYCGNVEVSSVLSHVSHMWLVMYSMSGRHEHSPHGSRSLLHIGSVSVHSCWMVSMYCRIIDVVVWAGIAM